MYSCVYSHKNLNELHCSTKALCIAQKTYFFMQYRVFIEYNSTK